MVKDVWKLDSYYADEQYLKRVFPICTYNDIIHTLMWAEKSKIVFYHFDVQHRNDHAINLGV